MEGRCSFFLHMWLLIKKTINFKLILLFQVQKCYEDNIYTAKNGYISNTKVPVTLIRRNNLKRMNSNKKTTWCDSFPIKNWSRSEISADLNILNQYRRAHLSVVTSGQKKQWELCLSLTWAWWELSHSNSPYIE